MPESERLAPGKIAGRAFGLAPDRDEQAPQLCQEALLTLSAGGYEQAVGSELPASPKRRRFGVRSLALGHNFLALRDAGYAGDPDTSPALYGSRLAAGEEMRGSANLALARQALEGLIDPATRKGQPGGWLLLPFHESLLWYDARQRSLGGRTQPWRAQRVWMRGGGITLARLLADSAAGERTRALGASAVIALRETLQGPSPLAEIADGLEAPLAAAVAAEQAGGGERIDEADREAWELGGSPDLAGLANRVCRHAEGVMRQAGASGPARLWQLRSVLALDVAVHALQRSWAITGLPEAQQHLLLSFGGPPRSENRVRQRSEGALNGARIQVREAILSTLAETMRELAREPGTVWPDEFVGRRGQLSSPIAKLDAGLTDAASYDQVAREIVDEADYDRPVLGFTGLLQTGGLIAGTGQYRYLTASPELFAALVGALSADMPMSSQEFFAAARKEWGLVIDQPSAAGTILARELGGDELVRNARRAEQQLADSGLALSLSDRTTVVGERARRAS